MTNQEWFNQNMADILDCLNDDTPNTTCIIEVLTASNHPCGGEICRNCISKWLQKEKTEKYCLKEGG